MTILPARLLSAVALLALALPIAACDIDVRRHDANGRAEVDVATPVGDVHVRTNVDSADTGLAVYPGATRLQDGDEPDNAHVTVGNSLGGVKVVVAKYESRDPEERIVDFYRDAMKPYGQVTECRGDVDFRNGRAVCREKFLARDLQLVVGPEERQRIVSVKPRGDGTEFALVYVQVRS